MKNHTSGFIVVLVIVLGLTLSTLFMLRLKILGSSVRQAEMRIVETQAFYLAQSAWRYAQTYPQNTAIYYVEHISLGQGSEGSLEASPGPEGWDLYGRAKNAVAQVEVHWYWDGKTLVDKTRKSRRSNYN